MGIDNAPKRTMKTTEKSLRILEAVERGERTVTDIANELSLQKSSVYTHLATLKDAGCVIKDGDQYRLGMTLLRLGIAARQRDEAYQKAKPITEQLAEETNERGHFTIEEQGEGIYLFEAKGSRAIMTGPQIGGRVPLHATASGKAILAYEEEQRRTKIVQELTFERFTPNTTTDVDSFLDELETVRERGFAKNEQEDVKGVNAIAAPVTKPTGEVVGALSVGGPAHRLNDEKLETELADIILGYVNELELSLGNNSSDTSSPYREI